MMNRMLQLFTGKSEKAEDPVDEFYRKGGKKSSLCSYNAMEVTDFSSQYGSEMSISYTASNLAGKGNIYPNYGDFTQACVFRTYGKWWDIVPSSRAPFTRTPPNFCSQDYIELSFQSKVYPIKIEIYETYNPGCVVRILACDRKDETNVDTGSNVNRWKTLWEGQPTLPGLKSRKFCPPLSKCPFPTDLIRLELCHQLVEYYTELDYVVLCGTISLDQYESSRTTSKECLVTDKDSDQVSSAMETLTIQPKTDSPINPNCSKQESGEPGTMVVQETSHIENDKSESAKTKTSPKLLEGESLETDNGLFDLLPEECIQLILSFLDVPSLCRVARTSRLLHKHSYDSLQYTELNLQPHWTQVNDVALESIETRSRFLQRLNLSWCHGNILSNTAFKRYIHACGQSLKCLYLSSCNFVDSTSLQQVADSCPTLTELDLSSCQAIDQGFDVLAKLKKLERLNLYRTLVNHTDMVTIIRNCEELRHLNLGSCNINSMDVILAELGKHARNLISLDLWRCRTVTHIGILALASGCHSLQELDLGWCTEVKSVSGCIEKLVQCCPQLKKLFLTANRTVCDTDLELIAKNCLDLEQLDILGTRQVSKEAAESILINCRKMKFFDVSFCSGIDNEAVNYFNQEYPNCAIKKSFQN